MPNHSTNGKIRKVHIKKFTASPVCVTNEYETELA